MSLPIWTPDALSCELRLYEGLCWRLVEAQHRVSTMKLVASLEEQALLEDLLEDTKPPVPSECRHLDYLLSTPFRYDAVYPVGSRFRRAGATPGVFYAGETIATAVAELAFCRILFYGESPDTPWPKNSSVYTAFSVTVSTSAALDLMASPLVSDRIVWTDPRDYAACQAMADAARAVEARLIRYESVRAPGQANLALLSCRAFSTSAPCERQTWYLHFSASGVRAVCDHPREAIEFGVDHFGADPRIRAMRWDRGSGTP